MENLLGIVIALAVIIFIFLISRAIVLWYWKIDKIVELLEEIEWHLNPNNSNSQELPEGSPRQKKDMHD
ncbi:MAG: hypothetical protein IPP68_07430 [Elusimicrobia bacterium]|nr:hypothetical protein [Elusimicrobiota bacterium]